MRYNCQKVTFFPLAKILTSSYCKFGFDKENRYIDVWLTICYALCA